MRFPIESQNNFINYILAICVIMGFDGHHNDLRENGILNSNNEESISS